MPSYQRLVRTVPVVGTVCTIVWYGVYQTMVAFPFSVGCNPEHRLSVIGRHTARYSTQDFHVSGYRYSYNPPSVTRRLKQYSRLMILLPDRSRLFVSILSAVFSRRSLLRFRQTDNPPAHHPNEIRRVSHERFCIIFPFPLSSEINNAILHRIWF